MVLQKVLMATQVEQREFVFWFNFCKTVWKVYEKRNSRNVTIKFFFFNRFVSTCANSHSHLSSTVQHSRPELFFFFNFPLKPACKL